MPRKTSRAFAQASARSHAPLRVSSRRCHSASMAMNLAAALCNLLHILAHSPGAQDAQPPCRVPTRPAPDATSVHAAQPKAREQHCTHNTSGASSAAQPAPNHNTATNVDTTIPPSRAHMPSAQGPAGSTDPQPSEVGQPRRPQLSEALSLVAPNHVNAVVHRIA